MPSWKKVIVSGSDASLSSLNVTNGVTGSLFGTSSYSNNADLLDGKDSSTFATTGSNTFIGTQTVTGSLFTSGSNTLRGNTILSGSVDISGSTNIFGTTNFRNSSTTITGSLLVSGSTTQVGNNTLTGNTTLSGSIIISGSQAATTASVQIFGDIRQTGYHRFDPVTTNIDTSVSASYIFVSGSTNDLYFSQNSKGYTNTTRLRWLEGNLYTGLLNGGLITAVTGSTTYQVSSGSGIIVNLNASLTDNPYPTIQYLNWGNLSASIAPLTASYQQAFVSIDSTGNIYQQGTPYAAGQFDTEINIGVVLFQNGSTINGVKTQPSVAYGFEQQQNIFNRAFGPLKLSGYTLAPSGSSTGSLIVASGTAYSPGSNYPVDPNNPSYATDNGTNVSKIFRYRQSGSTWVYDTNGGVGYTTIDPSQYSNNGVLTPVPTGIFQNRWSIQRVFYFPNSVAKAIVVYYGNAVYATQTDATSNIPYEPFVEAPNTAANAIYLGAIVARYDADFTNNATFNIQPGGLFRQVGGSGGGGSVVTTTLAGLSDVLISGPLSGQALVYDTTAAKWENKSFISASISGNAATATSASYAATASLTTTAQTASSADNFTVRGTLTAQTIIAQTITSSTVYSSGSNIFGNSLANTQTFTGSLLVTGSNHTIFGNVGIGITGSSAFRLDVSGSARVQGVTTINAAPAVNGDTSLIVNSNTVNSSSGQMYGIRSIATVSSTNTGNVNGIQSDINNPSTAVTMTGFNSAVNVSANTTSTANAYSVGSAVTGTGTISNFNGYDYRDVFKGGSGAVSRQIALRIANLTAGSVANVGILFNNAAETSVSGNWDIYAQSGNRSYFEGDIAIGTTTLGTATKLTLGGSETASSAIARGQLINTALTASANNDVLVGLDINPTFNTGSFTGVFNAALRVGPVANAYINSSNASRFGFTHDAITFGSNNFAIATNAAGAIQRNGNVSRIVIGTANVAGAKPAYLFAQDSFQYDLGMIWDKDVDTLSLVFGSNSNSQVYTPRLNIFNNGNVAINSQTNAGFRFDVNGTARFSGNTQITGSLTVVTGSAREFEVTPTGVNIGSIITDTHTVTGSLNISGSTTATSFTGSLLGTASRADNATSASFSSTAVSASFATTAVSASFATNAISASFATQANTSFTASSADNFTVRGTLTAQTIVAQTITSSTDFVTGSTRFGSLMSNTHQFTGSVSITGSLNVVGTGITGSLLGTASRADNATSASFASTAVSASFATNAVSASFAPTATNVYIQGGNSFGAQALLGTNDVQDLAFETSGSIRMLISGSNGNVGIGTTTPANVLHVHGSSDGLGYIRITDSVTGATATDGLRIGYNSNVLRFQNYENSDVQFLTNNTTEAIRIKNDGNVGIGTTNPGFKLDIGYDTNNRSLVRLSSNAANRMAAVRFDGNNIESGYIGYEGGSEIVSGGVQGDLIIRNMLSGKDIILDVNAGSVGIGTTSPSVALDVVGSIRSTGTGLLSSIRINNTTSTTGKDWHLYSLNNGNFGLYNNTDGSYAYQITPSGSVGIGTTSPATTLHVNGTVSIGATSVSSEGNLFLGPKSTTEGGQIFFQAGTSYTSASMLDVFQNDANPYFRILRGTNTASDALVAQFNLHTRQFFLPAYTSTASFAGTATAYLAVNSSGDVITVAGSGGGSVSGGSTNYIARWASSTSLTTGSIFDNGTNVGIGSISPAYKLDVTGDIRATGAVYANANGAMYFRGGDDAELWDINVANTIGIYGQQDQGVASIKLGSGGGIISGRSGSIGIGTTSPTRTFQVNGYISSFDGTTNTEIINGGGVGYFGTSTNHPLALQTNNTERLRITSGGNVGIGTTSPATTLDVNGTGRFGSAATKLTTYSDSNYSGIFNGASLGSNESIYMGDARMFFFASGSERMRLTSTGLGIGTTVPAYALEVRTLSGGGISIVGDTNNEANILFGDTDSKVIGRITYDNSADFMRFWVNGSERMRITSGGSVGIGTTSPSATLDLYQSSGTTSIKMASAGIGSKTYLLTSQLIGVSNGGFGIQNQTDSRYELVINADGNVGIGTTSPNYKLTVVGSNGIGVTAGNGNQLYLNNTGQQYTQITFDHNSSGATKGGIWWDNTNSLFEMYAASGGGVTFHTNATERMRITSGGNVGIGTTSPQARLDVLGGVQAAIIRTSDASTFYTTYQVNTSTVVGYIGNGNGIVSGGGINTFGVRSESDLIFAAGGNAERMRITNNGNVGIGTTTPIAKLDVEGDFQLLNANYNSYSSSVSGTTTLATIPTSSYNGVFFDFVAFSGSNQRAGTLIGNWRSGNVQYTEYSSPDIGSTAAALTMSVALSGANALVQSVSAPGWAIKATYRTV